MMSLPRLVVLASAALLCVVSLVSASPFQSPNRFLGTDVSPALSRRGGSRVYSSAALLEVTLDYKADSGGCRPLTNYEKHSKDSEWWDWEKRLESLASKVAKKKKPGQKAATVLNGLGDKNMWVQIVDGWAHLKGKDAFGPEYVTDMKRSFKACTELLTNEQVNARDYNVKAYDKLHHTAFEKTAHLLSKPNGFRGPHTGVYLPLPDKPLGVFHDIHENGKMTYNPKLRRIDRNSGASTGWKHNSGYLMRWVYPNLEIEFEKKKVQELFDHFWKLVGPEHIPSDWSKGQKRAARLDAIVWLYHSLENFHCFIDGNGRSNVLVLDTLLSWAGLHPVSFYNSMESALSSVAELREKVLEGYFMWEEAYLRIEQKKDFISGWNLKAIKGKNKECARAIDVLFGKEEPLPGEFVPDTLGGCVCVDSSTCDSNEKHRGRQWCFTTKNCTWKWDYCAKGRPRTHDSDHGHEESHHSDVLIPDLKFE